MSKARRNVVVAGFLSNFDMTSPKTLISYLYRIQAVRRGKFILTSGKESDIYIDGRKAALLPDGIQLIADAIELFLTEHSFDSLGCPEGVGSNLILGALLGRESGLTGFVVRKEQRQHGLQNMIEGEVGQKPILLDDVATSGKSLVHAVKHMPVPPTLALVVLDRQEGAAEALQPYGVQLRSLVSMDDLRNFQA